MPSIRDIKQAAREIVLANPGGIRFGAIVEQVLGRLPDANVNTVGAAVVNLAISFPNDIVKPGRGLYKPKAAPGETPPVPAPPVRREEDFYEPFATWLKNDLEEVTNVVALGGAGMRAKWGTPDVVGVYKPTAGDLIRFPPEIVTAEIKVDPNAPVVAFGQAVAYRLFSTKTYVVMPDSMGEEDAGRLEALCLLFGVGLVLFDPAEEEPQFQIRVRAQRVLPDMFYVNEFAERLKDLDREAFEKLFG